MKLNITLLLLLIAQLLPAQYYENKCYLYPFRDGDLWGYASEQSKIVIPPQYSEAGRFSEGRAKVKINGKYGFINCQGSLVIPAKYKVAEDFNCTCAKVKKRNNWRLINTKGKKARLKNCLGYSIIGGNCMPTYPKSIKDLVYPANGKYGIVKTPVNYRGDGIPQDSFPAIFDEVSEFGNDSYLLRKGNQYAIWHISPNMVLPDSLIHFTWYDEIIKPNPADLFDEGNFTAKVKRNGLWGFINQDGVETTPIIYLNVDHYKNRLAWVEYEKDKSAYLSGGNELFKRTAPYPTLSIRPPLQEEALQQAHFLGYAAMRHCLDSKLPLETRKACSAQKVKELIYQTLAYPEEARRKGIQGTVRISYMVDSDGFIKSEKLEQDIGGGCGAAVLDIIRRQRYGALKHYIFPIDSKAKPMHYVLNIAFPRDTVPPPPPKPQTPEHDSILQLFNVYESIPVFPNCPSKASFEESSACNMEQVKNLIYEHLVYPKKARQQKVTGTVRISYWVDGDGRIIEEKVEQDIGGRCGTAVLNVIRQLRDSSLRHLPSPSRGKAVKVHYTLDIEFTKAMMKI